MGPSADPWFSLCSALFSGLHPVHLSCLDTSRLSAPSPGLRESARLCLGSLFLLMASNLSHLIYIPSFWDYYFSLLEVQCLENHYFVCFLIYFVVTVLEGRINSDPVALSWPDEEVIDPVLTTLFGIEKIIYKSQLGRHRDVQHIPPCHLLLPFPLLWKGVNTGYLVPKFCVSFCFQTPNSQDQF